MHIKDILQKQDSPLISFEITPPDKGRGVEEILRTVEILMPFSPGFISVTYHQPHVVYEELEGVIRRVPKRKKPGTVGICTAIKHRFDVEPVPHIICGGFDRYETEDALIDLQYQGIENVLVLRGDPPPGIRMFIPEPDGYSHADELVEQIALMNRGIYTEPLEDAIPTHFCIGVAGYPEKHVEAPNAERDLENLCRKVEKGAHFVITQLFFAASTFTSFVERARAAGVTVPILPGIKPITSRRQLETLPGTFHVSLPEELVRALEEARTPQAEFAAGTRYMAGLVEELLDFGVPGLHLFTMGRSQSTVALLREVLGAGA